MMINHAWFVATLKRLCRTIHCLPIIAIILVEHWHEVIPVTVIVILWDWIITTIMQDGKRTVYVFWDMGPLIILLLCVLLLMIPMVVFLKKWCKEIKLRWHMVIIMTERCLILAAWMALMKLFISAILCYPINCLVVIMVI